MLAHHFNISLIDVCYCTELLQIAVGSPLGPGGVTSQPQQPEVETSTSDILDSTTQKLVLEKSNIIMLGPTGSGMSNFVEISTFVTLRLIIKFEWMADRSCGKTALYKVLIYLDQIVVILDFYFPPLYFVYVCTYFLPSYN